MRHALWLRYVQARTYLTWVLSRLYTRVSLFICAPALADIRENIRHLREQADDMSDELKNQQEQIDDLDREYASKDGLENLESAVETIERDIDSMNDEIGELEIKLEDLSKTVEENADDGR